MNEEQLQQLVRRITYLENRVAELENNQRTIVYKNPIAYPIAYPNQPSLDPNEVFCGKMVNFP